MTDWCVGDLAVCVDAREKYAPRALVEGRVYRVIGLEIPGEISPQNGRRNSATDGELALVLDGVVSFGPRPDGGTWAGYRASRFLKIRPDTHEACEAEFVTLLKRSKRRVDA